MHTENPTMVAKLTSAPIVKNMLAAELERNRRQSYSSTSKYCIVYERPTVAVRLLLLLIVLLRYIISYSKWSTLLYPRRALVASPPPCQHVINSRPTYRHPSTHNNRPHRPLCDHTANLYKYSSTRYVLSSTRYLVYQVPGATILLVHQGTQHTSGYNHAHEYILLYL